MSYIKLNQRQLPGGTWELYFHIGGNPSTTPSVLLPYHLYDHYSHVAKVAQELIPDSVHTEIARLNELEQSLREQRKALQISAFEQIKPHLEHLLQTYPEQYPERFI